MRDYEFTKYQVDHDKARLGYWKIQNFLKIISFEVQRELAGTRTS